MQLNGRVALVTGAGKGIGFEICRQLGGHGYRVVLSARNPDQGANAAAILKDEGLPVSFHPLDVTDSLSIAGMIAHLEQAAGRLDVLVNNAGVFHDRAAAALDVPINVVSDTIATNTLGPLRLIQAMVPLMRRNRYGRIINISSQLGQLKGMGPGWAAYRISKTALNAVTAVCAAELKDENILVNSMCPGWVRTDMGGPQAPRTPEQGADTALWLATLPDGGPTGGFFTDREPMAW